MNMWYLIHVKLIQQQTYLRKFPKVSKQIMESVLNYLSLKYIPIKLWLPSLQQKFSNI